MQWQIVGDECLVSVYLDNGNIYQYKIDTVHRARAHADAIYKFGFNYIEGHTQTYYPVHRIAKVTVRGSDVVATHDIKISGVG